MATTVVSVDGPRDLTVRRSHEVLRVRLHDIDAPRGAYGHRPAECGASLTKGALQRLAPVRRRLYVFSYGARESGRTLVDAKPTPGLDESQIWITDRLVDRAVARWGIAQPLNAHVLPSTDRIVDLNYAPTPHAYFYAADPVERARRHAGVWGACGDRFHAPARGARLRVRPAVWTVGQDGLTTRVGSLALFPTAQHAAALTTFAEVARAFPDLELVREYDGMCVGISGAAGMRFQGDVLDDDEWARRAPCAVQPIRSMTSLDRSATAGGLTVGAPAANVATAFPTATADDDYAELDGTPLDTVIKGDSPSSTRWRTAALLRHGRVAGFYARLPETDEDDGARG